MNNNPHFFPDLSEETLKYVSLREEDVVLLKRLKNILVRSQLYSEAAYLRDLEKRIVEILDAMAQHGFKPKQSPKEDEKVYSISEVNTMIGLATHPLKKAIEHYAELSRTAIVDHVASLIQKNKELQANQQATPENTQPDSNTTHKKCEYHRGCDETKVQAYIHKHMKDKEKIFLCNEHSAGYELYL